MPGKPLRLVHSASNSADPRVRLARKIVTGIAVLVGLSLVTAALFAAYGLTTEKPVKELFFEPAPAVAEDVPAEAPR